MEINRRLIGASAVFSPENKVVDVDIHGLVRRLLLFEKYVLVSVKLEEFPLLADRLGYEGLRDLLAAKLIEIRCECLQCASMGQSGLFGKVPLPLLSYRLDWLDGADRRKYVHDCLQAMHGVGGLQRKQVSKLKQAIAASIKPLPSKDLRVQVFPNIQNDLLHNPALVRSAAAMALHKLFGRGDIPFLLNLRMEDAETFRADTDLAERTGLSEGEVHKVVERAILGITGLNQSIAEMKFYSAISGFREDELPLFRKKLDFLAELASSDRKETSFQRVIDIADLPDFTANGQGINVDKLLKVRDSSEAREFRDWLGQVGDSSNEEIHERVAGLRVKAGLAAGSETGKLVRFLVTTGLSMIPPTAIAGQVLGVGDQFLTEKILPRSGVAAFVNKLYPSIFERT